ncbi:zinc finger matrin-type protein 5 isoform X2 [Alosa sapidissima]|uniref:zinc finger matrin-type protein 5 isoform X2 n=1 Tax=Alosa sapidissima TaxID=34773 RepID=UPI001C080C0D|nr:zinc finger matrin-type protein 5 isoform X2 [Alosa sapidissima]
MGKRYYCDYCDRSFQDNMHNRKKHLNGVQHHRAKKAWFDNFRDAAAILTDEQTKKPCRKFLQTGQCVFGTNCRFSHMTEREIEHLKRLAADLFTLAQVQMAGTPRLRLDGEGPCLSLQWANGWPGGRRGGLLWAAEVSSVTRKMRSPWVWTFHITSSPSQTSLPL